MCTRKNRIPLYFAKCVELVIPHGYMTADFWLQRGIDHHRTSEDICNRYIGSSI